MEERDHGNPAAASLTELFQYNIPERWSIAHLYQAILNQEEHVEKLDFFTTLCRLYPLETDRGKVLGVGDASGMFPIDVKTGDYDPVMVEKFDKLVDGKYPWKLKDLLPAVLKAGDKAGVLTEEGARLLDVSGNLRRESLCVRRKETPAPVWRPQTVWQNEREMCLQERRFLRWWY